MKQTKINIIVLSFLLAIISTNCFAQAQSAYKVGSRIKQEVTTYPDRFDLSSKFKKGSLEAKQSAAERLRADFAAGKIEPTKITTIEYTVISVAEKNGKIEVIMKLTNPAGDYRSILEYGKDSIYVHRCEATTPMKIKGDTVGFYYAGTEVVPYTLNVGDHTPGYSDLMAMFPIEKNSEIKTWFHANRNAYSITGYVTQKFKSTTTGAMLTMNQSGTVKEKSKINVGGKDVDTYMIGAEIWIKNSSQIDFQLEQSNYFHDAGLNAGLSKTIHDDNQTAFNAAAMTSNLIIDAVTGANEQGYIVNYREEWFSPFYGMAVKTNNYDNYGLLQSVIKLVSVD